MRTQAGIRASEPLHALADKRSGVPAVMPWAVRPSCGAACGAAWRRQWVVWQPAACVGAAAVRCGPRRRQRRPAGAEFIFCGVRCGCSGQAGVCSASRGRRRRTWAPARCRALPACPIHILPSGYAPCTLPRRGPTPYSRSAASLQAAVEGGRWRASGGDGDERVSAGQKTSAEHAPETSCGCPGACARAVGAAVVANGGRWWALGVCRRAQWAPRVGS